MLFSSVIESHPDNALEDLRLLQPFSELSNHIESYNLDSMDRKVRALHSGHLFIDISQFKLHIPQLDIISCFIYSAGSQSHAMGHHRCQAPGAMAQ